MNTVHKEIEKKLYDKKTLVKYMIFGQKKFGKHKCPRCNSELYFSNQKELEEKSKKTLNCAACLAPYRLHLNEKNKVYAEKIWLNEQEPIKFHSKNLKGEKFTFYEEPMPESVYSRLLSIAKSLAYVKFESKEIGGTIVSFLGDPMSATYMGQRGKRFSDSIEKQVLPTLETIYTEYPGQVEVFLQKQGLLGFLSAFQYPCTECGVNIPRRRVNNCPVCGKKAPSAETKDIEDPLSILKIRFAKGEITKEEYEEMKKTLQNRFLSY